MQYQQMPQGRHQQQQQMMQMQFQQPLPQKMQYQMQQMPREVYEQGRGMPAHMAPWQGHHPGRVPMMADGHHGAMSARNRDTGELSKTNIYISGLKSTTTDDDLKQLCQSYGAIVSAKAIIDRELNHCKGYGFVMFEKEASAKAAVDALVRSGAQAAFAKVTRAQTEWQGRQEADPTNLYLTNLPKDMDEQALMQMLIKCLDAFGEVVSCRVLRDEVGMSRGVGLARMDSRQACETIIKRLNGCVLPHNNEQLRVKFANGPSPRKFKFLHRDNGFAVSGRGMADPAAAAAAIQQGVYEMPLDAPGHMAYQHVPTRYMAMASAVPSSASFRHTMHDGARGADGGSKAAPAASSAAGSRLATWVGSESGGNGMGMGMVPAEDFARGFDPSAVYDPYNMPAMMQVPGMPGMYADGAALSSGSMENFFMPG